MQAPDRGVRVNRPETVDGPITWSEVQRLAGLKTRVGKGQSGLRYFVRQQGHWSVTVVSSRREEIEVGTARMQDHALALAALWEQAVLCGRIDMS